MLRVNVPKTLGYIKPEILNPRNAWEDKEAFDKTRDKLAEMFVSNYKKYQDGEHTDYAPFGPVVES